MGQLPYKPGSRSGTFEHGTRAQRVLFIANRRARSSVQALVATEFGTSCTISTDVDDLWRAEGYTAVIVDSEHAACPELAGQLLNVEDVALRLVVLGAPSASQLYHYFFRTIDVIDASSIEERADSVSLLAHSGKAAHLMGFARKYRLSASETKALIGTCAGLTRAEAAHELKCSMRTLETYWARIFGKVGVRTTERILAAVLREFLVAPPDSARARAPLCEKQGA